MQTLASRHWKEAREVVRLGQSVCLIDISFGSCIRAQLRNHHREQDICDELLAFIPIGNNVVFKETQNAGRTMGIDPWRCEARMSSMVQSFFNSIGQTTLTSRPAPRMSPSDKLRALGSNVPQPEIQASRFKSQVNSAKLLRANGV